MAEIQLEKDDRIPTFLPALLAKPEASPQIKDAKVKTDEGGITVLSESASTAELAEALTKLGFRIKEQAGL